MLKSIGKMLVALTISLILISMTFAQGDIPPSTMREIKRHMVDWYALHAANGPRWVDSALYAVAFGSSWNWEDSANHPPGIVDSANGGAARAMTAVTADTTDGGATRATTAVTADTTDGGATRATTCALADSAKGVDTTRVGGYFDSTYKSDGGLPIWRAFRCGYGIFQSGTVDLEDAQAQDTIYFPMKFASDSSYAITITPNFWRGDAADSLAIGITTRTDSSVQILHKWNDARYLDWIAVGVGP